jgi:hypothetical protein
MDAITTSGFDPAEETVIELPSGADIFTCVGECSPGAAATTEVRSGSELVIGLPAMDGGILTVRNAYDAGWRAEVDGHPARTVPVDGFLQGVVLPPGSREAVLTYHDDPVMLGLALGAAIWLVLLAAPLIALAVERRAASGGAPTPG